MVELTEQAGLPCPEFAEVAGAIIVRFLPSRYLPPQRVGLDLSERQQDLLQILGTKPGLPLREISEILGLEVPSRGIRDDLSFLKRLDLIESIGRTKGARWFLKGRR